MLLDVTGCYDFWAAEADRQQVTGGVTQRASGELMSSPAGHNTAPPHIGEADREKSFGGKWLRDRDLSAVFA